MSKENMEVKVHCSFKKMVNLFSLVPHPKNPNKHDQDQIDLIAKLIEQHGWRLPITVSNVSGFIVRGHGRLEAAKKLGLEEVPVDFQDYGSEEEELADLIADNRVSELSVMDIAEVKEILESFGDDIEKYITGYDLEEIEKMLVPNPYGGKTSGGLIERFGWAPFSVLDARSGKWQNRKKAWIERGIDSGDGRRDNLLGGGLHELAVKTGANLTGTSIFDPVLCELMYRWFTPDAGTILDPFSGGSVRGVIASILGYKYTGIDLRPEQIEANEKQGKKQELDPAPEWIVGNSLHIKELTGDRKFDFLFSCPPYADLEKYSDNPEDLSTMKYEDFRIAYTEIIKKSVEQLKDNRFAAFVVGEVRAKNGEYYNFVNDTVNAFIQAGMKYYNEAILVIMAGTLSLRVNKPFGRYRKLGKTHQNILIFYKGDIKKIPEEFGEIEFDESWLEEGLDISEDAL